MKRFCKISLSCVAFLFSLISCSQNNDLKWEYLSYELEGMAFSDYVAKGFAAADSKLNELGAEGWELVSCYSFVETVHPNFGNKEYVTGLQPNTRTNKVVFVFKRPLQVPNKK